MDLMSELRARLRVNKHALEDELETQAEVLDRIGREVSRADSRAQAAADRVKRMEASAFSDLKAGGSSDRVSELAARRDPDRMKAFDESVQARQELDDWRSLHEAWKARGFSIKELVALYQSKYFEMGTTSGIERPPAVRVRRDYTEPRAKERKVAT